MSETVVNQSSGVVESDGMGDEAVRQSDREDLNASVPSARWQEGEQFMRGHQNTDGFVGTACDMSVMERVGT